MWPTTLSLVLGFIAFILFDFLSSCFTGRASERNLRRSLRNPGQGRSELKPKAQACCFEDLKGGGNTITKPAIFFSWHSLFLFFVVFTSG
jgi:hypothetical protein